MCIVGLNSEFKNQNNFFAWAIFLIQKIGTNSVNYADSGDIKILVQFPGKSIFIILQNLLKMRRLSAWPFDSQNHPECSTFYADPGIHPIYSPVHLAISKDRPYLGTVNFFEPNLKIRSKTLIEIPITQGTSIT